MSKKIDIAGLDPAQILVSILYAAQKRQIDIDNQHKTLKKAYLQAPTKEDADKKLAEVKDTIMSYKVGVDTFHLQFSVDTLTVSDNDRHTEVIVAKMKEYEIQLAEVVLAQANERSHEPFQ